MSFPGRALPAWPLGRKMLEAAAPFLWLLGPLAAVLLLPLVVLAALTADGVTRVFIARFEGKRKPLPPLGEPNVLALLFRRPAGSVGEGGLSRRLAVSRILALASFLLIPQGRFPALRGAENGMILIPALLLLSGLLGLRERRAGVLLCAGLPVAAVLGVLSWVAWRTGMPGAPLGLEVFVVKSVWSVTEGAGTLGIAALAAALFFSLLGAFGVFRLFRVFDEEIGGSLRGLAAAALFVSLFVPFSALGRGGFLMAALDFPLFWFKVIGVRFAVSALFGIMALRLGSERAARLCLTAAFSLALVGGALALMPLL